MNVRIAAASIFILLGFSASAGAVPVSEATVERVCGDQIQGGCAGDKCSTGCEKVENGTIYTYGCTFPNRTGKTKATCSKDRLNRTAPVGDRKQAAGRTAPRLNAD
mgnify:CR=1 FL=1